MVFNRNIIPCILLFLIATACSVQKRVYRNGYHVVWNKKHDDRRQHSSEQNQQKGENPTLVSTHSDISGAFVLPTKNEGLILGKDTCGDVLFFKKGQKIIAKVIAIEGNNVRYKRCDNLDGPIFSVNKKSLALLQYVNGTKEDLSLQEEPTTYTVVDKDDGSKKNTMGLLSFFCALIGVALIIPMPLALIFAAISFSQFMKEPGKYKGRKWPRMALRVASVMFFIWSFVFLLAGWAMVDNIVLAVGGLCLALGLTSVITLKSWGYK
jgi:hypothetical protein